MIIMLNQRSVMINTKKIFTEKGIDYLTKFKFKLQNYTVTLKFIKQELFQKLSKTVVNVL